MESIEIDLLNGKYDLVANNEGRIIEMLKWLSDNAPEDITADDIKRMLTQDDYYMFAAISKEESKPGASLIVGLGIIFFREFPMGYKGFIEDVVTHEDHSRMGIATAIGVSMIKLARRKKARKIELRSGNQRKGGHGLWFKLGFKPANSTSFDLYLDLGV